MDSLDGTSFDSGSSAAALGSDPGSSTDTDPSDAQASWGQAMSDAGVGGNGSTDDTGWDSTSSPWDSKASAAAGPSDDSASLQADDQSAQASASDAQDTAASNDAYAAQARLDANAILRGMDDKQAAGPSSKGTQLACLEDACIVEGGAALALRYGVPLIAGAFMAPRLSSSPNTAAPAPDTGGSTPLLTSDAPGAAGQQAAPAAASDLSSARVDPGPLALPGTASPGPASTATTDGAGTTQIRLGLTTTRPQDHVLADPIMPQGSQVEGFDTLTPGQQTLSTQPVVRLIDPSAGQPTILSTPIQQPKLDVEGMTTTGPQGLTIMEASTRGPDVSKIGGKWPMNSGYAGQTYPASKLPEDIRGKYPDGVVFTPQGFPNFAPYAEGQTEIPNLTGDYRTDEKLANRAVGIPTTPDGYVWHHVEDGRTMQLVPSDLHEAVRHTGGAAIIKQGK